MQGDVTLTPESNSPERGNNCAMPSQAEVRGESTPPGTPSTLSTLAGSVSVSTSASRSDAPREDIAILAQESSVSDPGTAGVGAADSGSNNAQTGTGAQNTVRTKLAAHAEDSFEQAMAYARELEEKWFLTFEQFVGDLQREPFLCQFFAEQDSIDLSGTSVDPVLNPYTRTILATTTSP